MGKVWLLAGALCAMAACGDSPKDKCNDLLNVYCERHATCVETAGVSAADAKEIESSCLEAMRKSVSCEDAVEIKEKSYDACVEAVEDISCSTINASLAQSRTVNLPSVCKGSILGSE